MELNKIELKRYRMILILYQVELCVQNLITTI